MISLTREFNQPVRWVRSIPNPSYRRHMDTNGHTHFVGNFLPWHRMFLTVSFTHREDIVFFPQLIFTYSQSFEKALQDKCGYKGGIPYWDWTLGERRFMPVVQVSQISPL